MRARSCGHPECLARLEAALASRKEEMLRPAYDIEPMSLVSGSSIGPFKIPRRLADAEIALDAVMMCSR